MNFARFLALLLLLVSTPFARATVPDADVLAVIEEVAHRPTEIVEGVGAPHQEATTESPEAQAFYDQGLGWTHSYFWMEAARSFHQALRLDPNLALAHMGLFLAYWNVGARDKAAEHLQQAMERRYDVSDREKRYIEARQTQWEASNASGDQRRELHERYRRELANLIADYPDDAELWVARGQAAESSPGGIGQRGRIDGAAWYESALVRAPDHIGAHHYLLHCYENLRLYELAVYHAEQYGNRALVAPHGQHMVGHVLPRVGRWDDAIARFERAHQLEIAYYERERIPPYADWHHLHNLHLYGMALARQGDYERAGEILEEAFNTPARGANYETHSHLPYLEYLIQVGRLETARETGLKMAETHGAMGSVLGRILAAEALLFLGRTAEAEAMAEEIDALVDEHYDGDAPGDVDGFISQLRGELYLFSPDPTGWWNGEQTLLRVADSLLDEPSFDGWGEGLFRIERMARFAHRVGYGELVEKLLERMKTLDPTYEPSLEAGE